jgi:uncharacterized protein YegL
MKNNHTDITVVLDRSGSMTNVVNDTIGGFNKFIEEQKKAPGTANITLHQFDNEFETVINNQNIQLAAPLTDKTFIPRGMTALLDAIGNAINLTGKRLSELKENERAEHVIFVIITDGEENSSKEFTKEKIFEMIGHQRDKYSWMFMFLGAGQDAIQVAQTYNIPRKDALTYNSHKISSVFQSVSQKSSLFRCGVDVDFTDEDREKAVT